MTQRRDEHAYPARVLERAKRPMWWPQWASDRVPLSVRAAAGRDLPEV